MVWIALTVVGNFWPARAATDRFVSPVGDDMGGANDCTSPDGPCKTIQHAINESNPGDLIEVAAGTYTENVEVSQSVTIQGDAFDRSIVDGTNTAPVFIVDPGNTVTFSMLTIQNGNASGEENAGGGIQVNGATVTVAGCTISGNTAGGTGPEGGGIFNDGTSTLTVINSTIDSNHASGGAGGGIFNAAGGSTTVVNCTVTNNTANTGTGGGIGNGMGGTINMTNGIFAGNGAGGDCVNSGTIGTNSHNLTQDGTCSPAVTGDPKLGPLQNNGGPTFTRALLPTSPAIEAGDDSVLGTPYFLINDQRGDGFPRKSGNHVDIGAVEAECTITCPPNKTQSNDPNQCGATVTYNAPTSTGPYGAVVCSPASGSFFPVGTTTVACKSNNGAGPEMCSFTVSVTDTQPPSITCPATVTATPAPGGGSTVVTYPPPTASDNCPGVSSACSPPSGSSFPVGATTDTCMASDTSGNRASCSFSVVLFNALLQDESAGCNSVLAFNTTTGDYRFCCGGTAFTGKGTVKQQGSVITLTASSGNQRVTATLDGTTKRGSASLQSPPGTTRCTIRDNDVTNNTCMCK
jgi:hypothetical protein